MGCTLGDTGGRNQRAAGSEAILYFEQESDLMLAQISIIRTSTTMGHDFIPVNLNNSFIFISSEHLCDISVSIHTHKFNKSLHPIHLSTP